MGINPPNLGQDAFNLARLEAVGILASPLLAGAIGEYISTGKLELPGIPQAVVEALLGIIEQAEGVIGEPIFDAIIGATTGITNLGASGSQEEAAVRTIKRALGFGVGLPLVAGVAEVPLKALLGDHLGKTLFDSLKDISNEAGISFFLGLTLSNIFETAVGQPITEAIARQTRPARLGFREVRALFRAHALSGAAADDQLAALGYRDNDIALMGALERTWLSLGDLQQAYLYGLKDEAWVRAYLANLGLGAEDVDILIAVYLSKAQTTGAGELRTVAQTGYLQDHLSEAQYRAVLKQANVPQDSIDLEVEAANLQKSWGRLQLTVAEVKSLFQKGQLDQHAALQRLIVNGYIEQDALAIITSWLSESKAGKLGLSESRILSYLLGGLIPRSQAYAALLNLGYKADDAAFLADNPASFGGVYKYPLTPASILAALKDGDLADAQARELLATAGMAPEEIDLQVKVAEQAGRRAQKPKAPSRSLTEAQVLAALGQGLVEPSWALQELSVLGYSDADAALLVVMELTRRDGQVPEAWQTLS